MEPEGVKRRLAAVLAAEVAGYSRPTARDEGAAGAVGPTARRDVIDPVIAAHGGRVVRLDRDGFLAEFGTALDAVRCAMAMRAALAAGGGDRPAPGRTDFRFGISLGDVVVDGDDIGGDEIHVAESVRDLAQPGGICVSGNIHDQVHRRTEAVFADMGEHPVERLPEPVRVYRITVGPAPAAAPRKRRKALLPAVVAVLAVISIVITVLLHPWTPTIEPASVERMAFPLPDKPSLAVLPLDNASGDPGQDYFSDGITENIITSLSRVDRLFVIARNSTFVYKGRPVKVQTVAEELGVRFVLEGSVQRSGERVRITLQLVDALSGNHMWAEHYDREIADLFAVQDEIARSVARALQVQLTEGEQARIWHSRTRNPDAGDLLARGSQLFYRFTEAGNAEARAKMEQALEYDPRFSLAYAMIGWTHWMDAQQGWSEDREWSYGQAFEAAQKAMALDPDLPDVHALLGAVSLYSRDFEQAVKSAEHAVSLGPNHATNMALLGVILSASGRPEEAIPRFKTAMRLSPYYPDWFLSELGWAYAFAGQHQEAAAAFEQFLERHSEGPLTAYAFAGLALAYRELGREDTARDRVAQALEVNPDLTATRMRREFLVDDPEGMARMLETLGGLGLPE